MNSDKHKELFFSRDQYWVEGNSAFKKELSGIVQLINENADISFDWTKLEHTNKLTEQQLIKIQEVVANHAQDKLVSICKPYVEPVLLSMFGSKISYKIRVSAQIKGRWDAKILDKDRKGHMIDGLFYEDLKRPNLAFPTRPHQDLDNNGNRSSHTTIFYFSLTPALKNASLMEYAPFEDKVGLLPFSSKNNYSNEIDIKACGPLSWRVDGLEPGDISLMNAYTVHRSSDKAEIPRVALNIKIQPTNLEYLSNIYDLDLKLVAKKSKLSDKLYNLREILEDACNLNRGLLFEKAIVSLLLEDREEMENDLKNLCLFDVSSESVERMALGGLLRKLTFHVSPDEFSFLDNPLEKVVPFSCAAAILETVN